MTPEEKLLRKILRNADYLSVSTNGFTLDTTISTRFADDDWTPDEHKLFIAIAQHECPRLEVWEAFDE